MGNERSTGIGICISDFVISRSDAYSDAVGHLFQFLSDTIPGLPDSFRSEATLWEESYAGVRQEARYSPLFFLFRSPSEGRRSDDHPNA